jgi:Flp pilus assembly protein TadD
MKLTQFVTAGFVGLSLATSVFAASDGNETSTPSEAACKKDGKVFDEKSKKCVEPSHGFFNDDVLYLNARSMAYDGQYTDAIKLLQLVQNQDDPRVLNYLGFSNRKLGHTAVAMDYYKRALVIDPNYNLARSYMGQGMIVDGDMDGAKQQLTEIRNRGGADTWAYVMLENAIETRVVY